MSSALINKKLNQMFDYRHRLISEDLLVHATANKIRGNDRPMTIGITGSSGFIGSSLIPFITTGGHRVIRFIRHPVSDGSNNFKNVKSIQWNPSSSVSLNDENI